MSISLQTRKLSEIAELNPRLTESLESDTPVSFVPMSSVTAETASTTTGEERRYAEVSKGYTPFLNGDVFLAKITPCFENGKIAQATLTHRIGFGSTEFHVVRPHADKADTRYLLHFLRQERIRRDGERKMTGSAGQRRVPEHFLAGLEIPLPPLAEQRRIAAILDQAEVLRAKRRHTIAQLDTLTQAIFLDLFGDPTTNPKGWTKQAFSAVCETRLGKMLDQKQQTGNHRRPYLRNANVQWFRFDLSEVFEMDFDLDARKVFRLKPGDLLICEGGEPGRVAIWRGEIAECYYQKALHRGRPRVDLATPDYLAWLLWFLAHRGGLGDHVTSATIAHLTGEKLKAMLIPVPPLSLQHEFAHRAAAVEKLKTAHRTSLSKLDALFASLQHRAFRGKL